VARQCGFSFGFCIFPFLSLTGCSWHPLFPIRQGAREGGVTASPDLRRHLFRRAAGVAERARAGCRSCASTTPTLTTPSGASHVPLSRARNSHPNTPPYPPLERLDPPSPPPLGTLPGLPCPPLCIHVPVSSSRGGGGRVEEGVTCSPCTRLNAPFSLLFPFPREKGPVPSSARCHPTEEGRGAEEGASIHQDRGQKEAAEESAREHMRSSLGRGDSACPPITHPPPLESRLSAQSRHPSPPNNTAAAFRQRS
jgi:hypothetical protein